MPFTSRDVPVNLILGEGSKGDIGSGGSGGFFAVVINTRKLKTELFAFYFRVGSGGHGGTAYVVAADSGVAG